mgnify:CR=1 FL=1
MSGIFRPPFRRPPPTLAILGAPSTVSMPAELGTYEINGQVVTFNGTILVDSGSYAINGQDVAFNVTMGAGFGTYTITGQDAAFAVSMPAELGTYTLNGQDIVTNVSVAAEQGTYAITGQAVTFTVTMLAATGLYSITGQDIVTLVAMPVDAGSYVITGQDVEFRYDTFGAGGERKKRRPKDAPPLEAKRRKIKLRRKDGRIIEKDYLERFKPPASIEELGLPPLQVEPAFEPEPLEQLPAWLTDEFGDALDMRDALALVEHLPDPAIAQIEAIAAEAQDMIDVQAILHEIASVPDQMAELVAMREAQDVADIEAIFSQL